MTSPDATHVRALRQRLRAVVPHVLGAEPAPVDDPAADAGALLDAMVRHLAQVPDTARAWLLLTAVASCYPSRDELLAFVHDVRGGDPDETTVRLLRTTADAARTRGTPAYELDVVHGGVMLSVDYCARADHHTGIQRVTRETVPRLARDHDVVPVAWTDESWSMRTLEPVEVDRVMRWNDQAHLDKLDRPRGAFRLVVPWQATVMLMEVVLPSMCEPLDCLAEFSGSRLCAIGYDTIPLLSAELRPPAEPDNFVSYLTVLGRAERIAGISRAATQEFAGAARMFRATGRRAPEVVEVSLPAEPPMATEPTQTAPRTVPLVVAIGSQEMHKNHLALVAASETLWREGLDFELQLVGRAGWGSDELRERVDTLRARHRRVSMRAGVSDAGLSEAYRTARFSAFPSLHEGFGLPVAESLASGTPVLTTRYGSMAEIAADGGCVTVDPRDDDALVDAMRRLLTDDELVSGLRQAALARRARSWDDYAAQLWDDVIAERSEGATPATR